ncbi:MAG: PDZ domain-containing protein [Deltaproteobacteria bacterium]|nr:MAG: PDZ domain-containing protein [Deltaproteobacteria bacterium]
MRGKLRFNAVAVGAALVAALLLSVFRPSPEGMLTLGLGERAARAAPGQLALADTDGRHHDLTALRVFNRVLVRVRSAYVDTRRIDPRKMMYAALDSVQLNVPEVLVEEHPERDEVVVVVNDKRHAFSVADVDSPWRLSARLKDVFRFIQDNMNPGADLAQVEYSAVNGMLSTLDPHSVLLDPDAAKEMDVSTSGHFGGLGIVIGMRKGKLTVIRPMPGTPAARAGIRAGDHIVRINSESTDHLTLTGAVNRMRGKQGTKVTLWVRRKGVDRDLEFELTRDIIRVESVVSRYLPDQRVGYIKIKNFQSTTAREVKSAMRELADQGASAWVLDLRNNPGGLLEQAIQVADLFVDHGTIVTTIGSDERDARRATKKGTDTRSPVAVLVNGQSASASEIVAGALKNLDRAVVIGSTTFGKGSVQILYENKDGSKLKLTIAEYLTPGDLSIQSVGVPPDIELQRVYVPKQLKTARDQIRLRRTKHTFREADLTAHLQSRHAKARGSAAEVVRYLYERPARAGDDEGDDADAAGDDEDGEPPADGAADDDEPVDGDLADDEIVEDFEMKFARDFVAQARSPVRSRALAQSRRFLAQRRKLESERVVQALAALGIDWTAPAAKADSGAALTATVRAAGASLAPSPGADADFRAGEVVRLEGRVANAGTGPAYRVHAQVRSDDRVFDETELVFGRIDPGQSRTFTALVRVPKNAVDRVSPLSFVFTEYNGAQVEAAPLTLRIHALPRPVFAYSHQLIDDGNGDGLVQKGEPMRLRMTFKNAGDGPAQDVTAVLSNKSGGNIDGVVIHKGRFQFPEGLAPGESKTVEFSFATNGQFDRDELVLEMSVYDGVLSESVTDKLEYRVRPPSAGPAPASGSVRITKRATPLREGASADADVIGYADRGAVLALTGTEGAFYRVEMVPGVPAFVARDAAERSRAKPRRAAVAERWQVTPPRIALDVPSLTTPGDHYRLHGVVTDDTHVEDVYVFVSNREAKIDNKKVFYKSNRHGRHERTLEFEGDIPLWPGSNFITVVARENDVVQATRALYLQRAGGPPGAAAAR